MSVVIPLVPFGQPIDFSTWELFRAETGIAVVIDAAAMFDTIRAGSIPAVVSLHATKALGVGEGGFVVSDRPQLVQEIQKRSNFGFWGSREATVRSGNGKLSEYAAAVGLAGWIMGPKRAPILCAWVRLRRGVRGPVRTSRSRKDSESAGLVRPWSRRSVKAAPRAAGRELAGPESAPGSGGAAGSIAMRPLRNVHEATFRRPRLAASVIGLPCWRDLPNDKIELISEVVTSSAGDRRSMEGCEGTSTRPLFATVAYAEAFGLGSIDVPEWQTALLTRSIPGTEWFDALGCYPLTVFGRRRIYKQGGSDYARRGW